MTEKSLGQRVRQDPLERMPFNTPVLTGGVGLMTERRQHDERLSEKVRGVGFQNANLRGIRQAGSLSHD